MKKIFLLFLFSRAFFATAQNVGIGISNPTRAKLEVHGAVDATSAIFGGESSGISLQRNWPGIGFNSYYKAGHRYMSNGFGAVQFLDPINGYIAIDMFGNGMKDSLANSRRVLVIGNDGGVTIGGAQLPTTTLRVHRGTAPNGTAAFEGSSHASLFNYGTAENTYIRAGKTNGSVIINDIPAGRVVMQGPVGINTLTPDYPLEIRQANNRGLLLVEPTTLNNWEWRITPPSDNHPHSLELRYNGFFRGEFRANDGGYYHTSDRRLKRDIQPLPSLLDKVMKLQPAQYEMIHQNPLHQKSIGFIAQDVKPLFPQLVTVTTDTSHGYKGIADLHTLTYEGFSVIAVKAIQEQQKLIDAQEKEIQAQQEEIDALKKKLAQLLATKTNERL